MLELQVYIPTHSPLKAPRPTNSQPKSFFFLKFTNFHVLISSPCHSRLNRIRPLDLTKTPDLTLCLRPRAKKKQKTFSFQIPAKIDVLMHLPFVSQTHL